MTSPICQDQIPLPCGIRWRRVQASTEGGDPSHAYAEILDTAEVLLCYAAQLGLAISREAGISLGAAAMLRTRLVSGRGPGFGDWVAILLRGIAVISYRQLVGDHAIVPHQSTEHHDNDLEQGSLYIIDSESQWHLLRPFLVGRGCPVCKNWSTFHADRERGALVIKSLETSTIAAHLLSRYAT
jgi:hypothetical protein